MAPAWDSDQPVAPSRTPGQRLLDRASRAADIRTYSTHPDVVALQVERARRGFNIATWIAVLFALAYTAANVQAFAAAGASSWSVRWWMAWLLDPMVMLVLVPILFAEQVLSSCHIRTPAPARWAQWFALAATYTMNTWTAWSALIWSNIVVHSVPPLLACLTVWAAPGLRDKLTDAVAVAVQVHAKATEPASEPVPTSNPVHVPEVDGPAPKPVRPVQPRRGKAPALTGPELASYVRRVFHDQPELTDRNEIMAAVRSCKGADGKPIGVSTSRRTEVMSVWRSCKDSLPSPPPPQPVPQMAGAN